MQPLTLVSLLVGAALLGAGAGAGVQGLRWSADMAQYRATVATDAENLATLVSGALVTANIKRREAEDRVTAQQLENATNAAKAQREVDRLNDCLRTGKCGLRVAATCPVVPRAAGTAGAEPAPGRDSDGTPRLTAAAGQRYMDFRRRYREQLATLRTCKVFAETKKAP